MRTNTKILILALALALPLTTYAEKNLDDVSITLTPPDDPDYFADHSTKVGDINNDGYDDVVLSSSYYGANERGALYLMYGRKKRFSAGEVTAVKMTGRSREGIYVDTQDGGCDLNADGYDDVLVSTSNYNYDTLEYVRNDRLYILYGRAKKFNDGRVTAHDYIDLADNINLQLACNGDLNNDGYDDIVMGDASYDGSVDNAGRVQVITGHPGSLTTADYTAATTWNAPDNSGTTFGYSIGYAGDVNADGYADLLISQVGNNELVDHGGKVYLVYGSGNVFSNDAIDDAVSWFGTTEDLYLGSMVSSAGDLNGDGFDDIVIGATYFSTDAASNAGALYLYYGKAKPLAGGNIADNDSWIYGTAYHNYIGGSSTVSFGQVDDDHFSDLVFYSFINPDTEHYGGEVYIQFGSKGQISSTPTTELLKYYRLEHVTDGTDRMGDITVADLNGNGQADIIVVNPNISQVQVKYN
ncbi:MAG: FG-GAP repeat protein [Candidatus Kerfeldbacteria bacterium]|nr:FG-GAP repeat protein [Candidatus Kerfeldbacteria bacterium]